MLNLVARYVFGQPDAGRGPFDRENLAVTRDVPVQLVVAFKIAKLKIRGIGKFVSVSAVWHAIVLSADMNPDTVVPLFGVERLGVSVAFYRNHVNWQLGGHQESGGVGNGKITIDSPLDLITLGIDRNGFGDS